MKSILLTLLVVPFFVLCQVYKFDYCLIYQINKIKPESEKWGNKTVFLNTEDRSYTMYSYDFSQEQTKWIEDFNAQMSYKFLIEKSKDSTELYYYDYARKFIEENSGNDIRRVEVNKKDDFSYIIKAYHKGRKPSFTLSLEIQKADEDLLFINLPDTPENTVSMILTEFKKSLKGGHYLVKSIEYENNNGYKFKTELVSMKKEIKKIKMPSDLKFRVEKQFENHKGK